MLRGQVRHMVEAAGYEVTIAAGEGPELAPFAASQGAAAVTLPLERRPSPWRDLAALFGLVRLIRALRPDVIELGTPKASLLGALAARLAGGSATLYTLHGLRAETSRGVARWGLLALERLTSGLADRTVCVSESLRARARELGALGQGDGVVLGAGSANGVDLARFAEITPHQGPPTIGFVGRFTRDKGLSDLLAAFRTLRLETPDVRLLLVGDFEPGDPLHVRDKVEILTGKNIDRPGFVDDPTPFYGAMDVLALPSLREGLPQVVLEAAAAGVPTVAARATGSCDAVVDGETGLLVPAHDADALADALRALLQDEQRRRAMGAAARERARLEFVPEALWRRKQALYEKMRVQCARPWWERAAKRLLDVGVAAGLLVITSPILAAASAAVALEMGRPVLFRQRRPGREERMFELVKLRSMRNAVDRQGRPLPDELRLTRLGRFLRRWSIDELPQLWNVLRGEMSLVGPRPLLAEYLPLYDERQRRRHWLKPGITGWAQVNGRNELDWERRFELDVWYVENHSLRLDLSILLATVAQVLKGSGVSAADAATPRPFRGSATI